MLRVLGRRAAFPVFVLDFFKGFVAVSLFSIMRYDADISQAWLINLKILGVFAAVLAFFVQWGVYHYIAGQLAAGTGVLTLLPFESFASGLAVIMAAAGLVFGIGGRTLTIRKFMRV